MTGLATSTSAGPKPRKNAAGPSVLRIWRNVSSVPSFRCCLAGVDDEEEGSDGVEGLFMPLTAWEVCTTQIGLLIIVVAEPDF